MPNSTLALGPDQTLHVLSSSPDALVVESTWEPATARPIAHWHPHQHEHFTVIEGRLSVELADQPPLELEAGEVLEVPPRTRHRMWSNHESPTRATWRITPARRTEEMFRRIDRGLSPLSRPLFLWRFRHEFRIGTPRA